MKDNFLETLYQELHGEHSIEESAYARLLRKYKRGDETSRRKYRSGIREALDEISKNKREWQYSAFLGLLRIVEGGDIIEVGYFLRDSLHAGVWRKDSNQLERAILCTLIKLGESPSPKDWFSRYAGVCSEFPNITFSGLVVHGLEAAFESFHIYVRTKDNAEKVIALFEKTVLRHGSEAVVSRIVKSLPYVKPEVANELREWLKNYNETDRSYKIEEEIEIKETTSTKSHYFAE